MPYAPAVQDRGADYLFQGISSAGNSIGRALDYYAERREKQKEEDKQRARKFKSLVDYMDASGIMSKDVAVTKDLDSLEGYAQGVAAKQVFDKAKAEAADREALASFARDYVQGDPAAMAGGLADFGTAMAQGQLPAAAQALGGMGKSAAPQRRLDFALGRNPRAFGNPQFDNSVSALQRFSGVNPDGTPSYTEDPVTGFRNVMFGKSILPTGVNPSKLGNGGSGGLKELTSPGGQLLGFIHTDIRGKETFIKPPPSVNLKQARDEGGNALPGIFMDSGGKSHDFRDYYQKFGIDKPAPTEEEQSGFWSRLFGKGEKKEAKPAEPAAAHAPAASTNEVVRVTKDGKRAVFDSKTKQFLRYAD